MRCKVGDRAVIVGGIRDNIGHLVNVVRPHSFGGGWWVVEILGRCTGWVGDDLVLLAPGKYGAIRDTSLWPLRDTPEGTTCLNATSEKR